MGLKGFTLAGQHSADFGIYYKTRSMPHAAPKRSESISVQGRDGEYVFEDGYDNKTIDLNCILVGPTVFNRRKQARDAVEFLSQTGVLIFDTEPDMEYEVVKIVNDISAAFDGATEVFNVRYECEPIQENVFYNDDLTWATAITAWGYTPIPWLGYDRIFTVTGADSLTVTNAGTYKALPIIKLDGTATTITIGGLTFANLSGVVYIDCKNHLVYEISGGSKVNRISDFSGDFIELAVGDNVLAVSGTITSVEITFDYRNTYI